MFLTTPFLGCAANSVVRGGSWNNNQHNAACAYRNNNPPDNRNNNIGFRCSKTTLTSGPHAAEDAGWPLFMDGGRVLERCPGGVPCLALILGLDEYCCARWRAGVPVGRRAFLCEEKFSGRAAALHPLVFPSWFRQLVDRVKRVKEKSEKG